MNKQFNSSLSQVQKWRMNKIVKRKIKLTVTLTMTNGAQHRRNWQGEAIIIRRADVEKVHAYARNHRSLRDFLIVHLPTEIGIRNSEIRTLRIENIDFESRSFEVLDSKRKEFYPLPLDMLSLQLIRDLVDGRTEGYVFLHSGSWTNIKADEPLSKVEIWQITHDTGEAAGIAKYNPRLGRHYFAAHWIFDLHGSIVVLQRILRHKNLAVTTIYVSKLCFFEDLQREFEGIQASPLVPETAQSFDLERHGARANSSPIGNICSSGAPKRLTDWVVGETICNGCRLLPVCKFAPLPKCVEMCKYKPQLKKEI